MAHVAPEQDAFRAIADPNRRRMLDAMLEAERTVGELTQALGIRQPSVSQHMQVLKLAGLVTERRAGRHTFYAARPAELGAVGAWLAKYQAFWSDRLDALDAHLRTRKQ
jgi:DNA-binding transcriptional ArsR family regulator